MHFCSLFFSLLFVNIVCGSPPQMTARVNLRIYFSHPLNPPALHTAWVLGGSFGVAAQAHVLNSSTSSPIKMEFPRLVTFCRFSSDSRALLLSTYLITQVWTHTHTIHTFHNLIGIVQACPHTFSTIWGVCREICQAAPSDRADVKPLSPVIVLVSVLVCWCPC